MFYCPLGVNLTMVFIAAVAGMIFGGIWYSGLFHKAWAEGLGKTQEQLGNPWVGMAVMFVSLIVTAIALNLIMIFMNIATVRGGIKLGLLISVGFVATAMYTNDTYENRPAKLSLINIGYQAGSIVLMSVLLARFR